MAKRTHLEEDIGRYKSALAAFDGGGESVAADVAALRAKLEAAEAALTKVVKAAPSANHERKALAEARTAYESAVQARKDREQRGMAKAAERRTARGALSSELAEQLVLLSTGLAALEDRHAAAHAQRRTAADALDAEVYRLFDARVAEVASGSMEIDPLPSGQPGTPASPLDPSVELAQLKEANAALLQRLEQAAVAATAQDEAVSAAFVRAVELAPADMPEPALPVDPDHVRACGVLHLTLDRWATAGGDMPFTWAMLREQAGAAAGAAARSNVQTLAVQLAKPLVGPAWSKFYASEDPDATDIVPRQVVLALQRQLGCLKAQFDAGREAEEQAESNFAAIKAGHKRARLSRA